MPSFSKVLLLALAVPASAAWGEAATTEAPKKSDLDVEWPPKSAIDGSWQSPISIKSPITMSPLGVQMPFTATAPKKSIGCKWDAKIGDFDCSLKSTSDFSKRKNAISVEKKVGSVCCKVDTAASWPPKLMGSIRGSVDAGEAGTICYDLKAPLTEPGYYTGSFKLQKEIGDAMCSVSTPAVFPPTPKATIKKSVGPVCCTLSAPLDIADPTTAIKKASASATYSKTFDTGVGPVCCTVESDLKTPLKPYGTATLKKKIGAVCANLEATTSGLLKCSFDSNFAETSEGLPKLVGIVIGALAGALAGSGITFVILAHLRRGVAGTRQEPLLEA